MSIKSSTKSYSSHPAITSLVGGKSGYKTTISGGGKTRSGVGSTSKQSQSNASKNWNK